jgi:gamma-glutamyl phosphate reductase
VKRKKKKALRKLMRHELAMVERRLGATLDTVFQLVALDLPVCRCIPGETCAACTPEGA